MSRPKIVLSRAILGTRSLLNLTLATGGDPGAGVQAEFVALALKHSLCPEGGCYDVNAIDPITGETIRYLGGMYVAPEKLNAVLADLRSSGYEIENKAAA